MRFRNIFHLPLFALSTYDMNPYLKTMIVLNLVRCDVMIQGIR